jgi:hypothetical protein
MLRTIMGRRMMRNDARGKNWRAVVNQSGRCSVWRAQKWNAGADSNRVVARKNACPISFRPCPEKSRTPSASRAAQPITRRIRVWPYFWHRRDTRDTAVSAVPHAFGVNSTKHGRDARVTNDRAKKDGHTLGPRHFPAPLPNPPAMRIMSRF